MNRPCYEEAYEDVDVPKSRDDPGDVLMTQSVVLFQRRKNNASEIIKDAAKKLYIEDLDRNEDVCSLAYFDIVCHGCEMNGWKRINLFDHKKSLFLFVRL